MRRLLEAVGTVRKWQRATDPHTNEPKRFGFVDFVTADGVLRAQRVLPRIDFRRGGLGGGGLAAAAAAAAAVMPTAAVMAVMAVMAAAAAARRWICGSTPARPTSSPRTKASTMHTSTIASRCGRRCRRRRAAAAEAAVFGGATRDGAALDEAADAKALERIHAELDARKAAAQAAEAARQRRRWGRCRRRHADARGSERLPASRLLAMAPSQVGRPRRLRGQRLGRAERRRASALSAPARDDAARRGGARRAAA